MNNWVTVNMVNAAHSPMTERLVAIGAIVGLATRQATFAADARIARRKPSKRSIGTAPGTGNRYDVRFEFKTLGDCTLPLTADCPTRTHAVELRDALLEMGAEKVKIKVRKMKTQPEPIMKPIGQRFPSGCRVHIKPDPKLSQCRKWMGKAELELHESIQDVDATVEYSHAQRYGHGSLNSYSLHIDGVGSVSWFEADELEQIHYHEKTPVPTAS